LEPSFPNFSGAARRTPFLAIEFVLDARFCCRRRKRTEKFGLGSSAHATGEALAIFDPRKRGSGDRHFQERIPYGPFVPDVDK
jgi:hypothetical protein